MFGLHQEASCDTLYSDDPEPVQEASVGWMSWSGAITRRIRRFCGRGEDVGNGREKVTHFKYRIKVGDEYTYRSGAYALDLLVSSLLEGVDEHTLPATERLAAKARGEEVPEQLPRPPVQAQDIQISVVVVEPPKRRPQEGWHKVS